MNGISKEFPTGFPTSGWISRKAPSASFIRQRILNPPLYYLVHNTIFLRIKITYIRISSKIFNFLYLYLYIYIFIYNNYLSQKSRFLPKLICDSRNSFQWLTKLIESSFICCSKEKKSKLGCRRRQFSAKFKPWNAFEKVISMDPRRWFENDARKQRQKERGRKNGTGSRGKVQRVKGNETRWRTGTERKRDSYTHTRTQHGEEEGGEIPRGETVFYYTDNMLHCYYDFENHLCVLSFSGGWNPTINRFFSIYKLISRFLFL